MLSLKIYLIQAFLAKQLRIFTKPNHFSFFYHHCFTISIILFSEIAFSASLNNNKQMKNLIIISLFLHFAVLRNLQLVLVQDSLSHTVPISEKLQNQTLSTSSSSNVSIEIPSGPSGKSFKDPQHLLENSTLNLKQLANLPIQGENHLLPLNKNEEALHEQKGFSEIDKRLKNKGDLGLIDPLSFSNVNSTELNITNFNNSFPSLNNSDFSLSEKKNNESNMENITIKKQDKPPRKVIPKFTDTNPRLVTKITSKIEHTNSTNNLSSHQNQTNATNSTQSNKTKKEKQLPLGATKFADSGLDDRLIPPERKNDPAFKKVQNLTVSTTYPPQLLDLKKINRTLNGSNNNQFNKSMGIAGSTQIRLCPTNYADGDSEPISTMPNPRQISNIVGHMRDGLNLNKNNVTLLFTIWGQFIDHDIEQTPANQSNNLNIPIPKCEKFFDSDCKGNRSIPFSRSFFDQNTTPKTPINNITTWIDASMVYGSNEAHGKKLRLFKEGKLKTGPLVGARLLPPGPQVNMSQVPNNTISNQTMEAGDSRSNENLILLSLQTLFHRQHNRICDLIIRNTKALSDDQIYSIARNYVTGLIQKITYDDYLPILLGKQNYEKLIGQYTGYDQSLDSTISVQFSAAGFRFGHSLLVPNFPLVNLYGDKLEFITLDRALFRPDLIDSVSIERVFRGASRTITKIKDGQFIDQIRHLLIVAPEIRHFKMDLLAINIQRGRDLGLLDYNSLRECLGLPRLTDFNEISSEDIKNQQLKQVYKDIDHIDTYVGIQTEKVVSDSILGQTGLIVVGQQFRRLRDADRFWYEKTFPPKIVQQIKKTKLVHIIMRNTAITEMQQDVFHYSFGG